MGMNSDAAWCGIDGGFDIPKDRNGQALIWLDYEVNADGSVLIKLITGNTRQHRYLRGTHGKV